MITNALRRRLFGGSGWAHVRIGHSGAIQVQTLVDLDDAYDTAEYVDKKTADLDQDVLAEAQRLLQERS